MSQQAGRGIGQTNPSLTKAYLRVFQELANKTRYATYSVGEFYVDREGKPDPDRINVVVRIDVDSGFHLSVPLAKALRSYDIHATHFLLTHPERYYRIWGSGIPRQVRHLGHEVGLHTDHYYEQLVTGQDGLTKLRQDIQRLCKESGGPIRGMCFHGHTEINALGHTNWELTKNVPPQDLGLEYHDGYASCYIAPGAKKWRPACDMYFSDFFGFPNSWGWNYFPSYPMKRLREAKRGEIVHLTFHTKNAFYYWRNWSAKYGEKRQPREKPWVFLKKLLLVRWRYQIAKGRDVRVALYHYCFAAFAVFLARYVGFLWPRPASNEFDTSRSHGRELIFTRGLEYWRDRLEELGMAKYGGTLIDVGSGNGQWLLVAAQYADRVIGVEPFRENREYSIKKVAEYPDLGKRIDIVDARAEGLPFKSNSIDRVLCVGVLMFTDQDQALREMGRVLKPDGVICLTVNGLGYFLMYVLNGFRYRSVEKMRYGLLGIGATLAKWWIGKNLRGPKATGPKQMGRLLSQHGLELCESRLWLAQPLYPYRHLGFATNYAFIARKKRGNGSVH